MVTSYKTIKEKTTGRFEIEKSAFLFICLPIESAEDAEAGLLNIRKLYPDATHHCYAYIADDLGNVARFSDDGEPQGTAGMPMLEVLKANALRHILVCAVRWFGGKKLGAGGLTRAYARAAKEAVSAATVVTRKYSSVCSVAVSYPEAEKITRVLNAFGAAVLNTAYGNVVSIVFAVPLSDYERVLKKLDEAAGRALAPEKLKEAFL